MRPMVCDQCGHSGFKGRIGVFEAVRVDETIRRLINDSGDEGAIAAHAFRNAPTLASSAKDLVLAGATTAEEAVRVSRRDAVDVEPVVDAAAFSLSPCGRGKGPARRRRVGRVRGSLGAVVPLTLPALRASLPLPQGERE